MEGAISGLGVGGASDAVRAREAKVEAKVQIASKKINDLLDRGLIELAPIDSRFGSAITHEQLAASKLIRSGKPVTLEALGCKLTEAGKQAGISLTASLLPEEPVVAKAVKGIKIPAWADPQTAGLCKDTIDCRGGKVTFPGEVVSRAKPDAKPKAQLAADIAVRSTSQPKVKLGAGSVTITPSDTGSIEEDMYRTMGAIRTRLFNAHLDGKLPQLTIESERKIADLIRQHLEGGNKGPITIDLSDVGVQARISANR